MGVHLGISQVFLDYNQKCIFVEKVNSSGQSDEEASARHGRYRRLTIKTKAAQACKHFYGRRRISRTILNTLHGYTQGILKEEVSLYCWRPVWLVWISPFCK